MNPLGFRMVLVENNKEIIVCPTYDYFCLVCGKEQTIVHPLVDLEKNFQCVNCFAPLERKKVNKIGFSLRGSDWPGKSIGRKLVVLLVLLIGISNCGPSVPQRIEHAQKLCSCHSGIAFLTMYSGAYGSFLTCNDGTSYISAEDTINNCYEEKR